MDRTQFALYYPETICLDEATLNYMLLLYDKVFFLPIDSQPNPGHETLSKRFSMFDSILAGAFKSREDAYYAIMYSSESKYWDNRLKKLMDTYDELEESGICIGLKDNEFLDPHSWHPLKVAVDADMADNSFVLTCKHFHNKKVHIPGNEQAKIKGGGVAMRPYSYKGEVPLAAICSERLNSALYFAEKKNLYPVCVQPLYTNLFRNKLDRISKNASFVNEIYPSFRTNFRFNVVSWEITTEVVSRQDIANRPHRDILKYKDACGELSQRFKEYINQLESEITSEPWDEKSKREMDKLINNKVVPEITKLKTKKKEIWEKLIGSALKSALSQKIIIPSVGGTLILGLSYWQILALSASIVGSSFIPALINGWQEERKLRRNALFFLLDFAKGK